MGTAGPVTQTGRLYWAFVLARFPLQRNLASCHHLLSKSKACLGGGHWEMRREAEPVMCIVSLGLFSPGLWGAALQCNNIQMQGCAHTEHQEQPLKLT